MTRAVLLFALAPLAFAQTAPPRVVRATGTGSVTYRPDQAKLNLGVITQAATAEAAAADNATRVDAVIKAVTSVLGTSQPIRTISYVISPNYRNVTGQPAQLTGYTVSNTIEVTMADTAIVGKVIDAASKAGANNVSSLRFLLANAEPARQQALAAAARQARAHADAIATGLGGKTGAVLAAQEGYTVVPVNNQRLGADMAASVPTPIEAGTLEISATVSIEVELL
jgi:uncharacterized protein